MVKLPSAAAVAWNGVAKSRMRRVTSAIYPAGSAPGAPMTREWQFASGMVMRIFSAWISLDVTWVSVVNRKEWFRPNGAPATLRIVEAMETEYVLSGVSRFSPPRKRHRIARGDSRSTSASTTVWVSVSTTMMDVASMDDGSRSTSKWAFTNAVSETSAAFAFGSVEISRGATV